MRMKRVLAGLAGKMRRMASGFRDKPSLAVDDYVLEHFLLYNGLIGSVPENQPDYVDVRNDIVQAINDGSGHQLAIALKVAPLWWEERLEKVFNAIGQINPQGAVDCLLAERPDDDITGDTASLTHSDWRVRSNAARMLAVLECTDAVPRLAELLKEDSDSHKSAFCHIAYSLAKLGTDEARQALVEQIAHDEHWFRVDAAGALAHFDLQDVAVDLMNAMLTGCQFDDYMAVAISRKHHPAKFVELDDERVQEGLAEMSLALLKAMDGPFHSEQAIPAQLGELTPHINKLAQNKPSARRLAAAIELNRRTGLDRNASQSQVRDLSRKEHYDVVKACIENGKYSTAEECSELKHALALAGRFKLTELAPNVMPLLNSDCPVLQDAVSCIAALGHTEAAPLICKLIEEKINLGQRTSQAFSAHPVVESDKESTDFYWTALQALGSIPHESCVNLLSRAVNDYAPDKREQALLSLQNCLLTEDLKKGYGGDLTALVRERLQDPSTQVQAAALNGIAQHKLLDLLPELIATVQSKEQLVQRKSVEALISLSNNGHKSEMKSALDAAISKEMDSNKKKRLSTVLTRIVEV